MNRWNSLHTLAYRLARRTREERGQALVEFAVVLPVLILIIMGIIYFGRYEDYSNQETQLAAEAARYASVDVDPSSTLTLQNYILSQASPELLNGSSDVSTKAQVFIYYPTTAPTGNTVGNQVRACVVATVQFPFLGGSNGKMVETSSARIEAADGTNNHWTADNTATAAAAGCPIS
jgi:Flp pilus assembly protein TadG